MRKLYLMLLLIVATATAKAQVNSDSLYSIWEDETKTDSARVLAYYDYIWAGFLFSNPDSALVLIRSLDDYSEKKNFPMASINAFNLYGIAHHLLGNSSLAIQFFKKRLDFSQKAGDKLAAAGSLNNIGMMYDEKGQYASALDCYKRSLTLYEELGDALGQAMGFNKMGTIYQVQKDFGSALKYYKLSLTFAEEAVNKRQIATSLNNMGNCYKAQEEFVEALECYKKSLAIREEGDARGIALTLGNIGKVYEGQGKPLLALEYFEKSLFLLEEKGIQKGLASALNTLGLYHQSQGNATQAIKYCLRGWALAQESNKRDQQKACNCLYISYKDLGNNSKALYYIEKLLVIEDSLQFEETAKRLEQMEFAKIVLQDSMARAEEVRLIEEAHQEEVREKNRTSSLLAGSVIFVLLFAGFIYSRLRFTKKAKADIEKEKDRSEKLLLNILPSDIAAELKEKGRAEARDFDMVSILFTDFKGFTAASENLSAQALVSEINICFEAFDGLMEKYKIEKIKTIGDAYMAAGGLPNPSDDSVKNTVLAALEMQAFIGKRKLDLVSQGKPFFEMRLGIHTGPVVAGIVGVKKFAYDIWGDTVNTASRMESGGAVGQVNISQSTYLLLKDDSDFKFESRGKIEAKGKGEIEMYFVSKREPLLN